MAWISKIWRTVLGGVFILWRAFDGLLKYLEHAEYIEGAVHKPERANVVIDFLLNPPAWITIPAILTGLLLICWDYLRHGKTIPKVEPVVPTIDPQRTENDGGLEDILPMSNAAIIAYDALDGCLARSFIDGFSADADYRILEIAKLICENGEVTGIEPPSQVSKPIPRRKFTRNKSLFKDGGNTFIVQDSNDKAIYTVLQYTSICIKRKELNAAIETIKQLRD